MERILLNDVSLQFRVRQQGRVSLKDFVIKGLFREKRNPYVQVQALKHLNLRRLAASAGFVWNERTELLKQLGRPGCPRASLRPRR